jgi:ATP-dependent Clp protease protease subunit
MSKQLTVRMKGDDTAEVLLYDVIGADMFGGIDAKTFRAQIKAVKAKAIELRINSPGGSVTEAAAMLQALDEFPGRIDVTVDGLAASAATVVMMAGDSIVAARNALLMIHNPWAGVMGTAADMRRVADLLDKIRGQILDTYAGRPGMKLSREELSAAMDAETWYTGQEAAEAGLIDAVTEPVSAAAFAGLGSDFAARAFRRTPAAPANSAPAAHPERAATERRLQLAASLALLP